MDMFPLYFEDYPKVARVRHDRDALWLEPTFDASGLRLTGNRRKVGPIETELRYAESQGVRTLRPIPAADKYLDEYIGAPSTGVIRG